MSTCDDQHGSTYHGHVVSWAITLLFIPLVLSVHFALGGSWQWLVAGIVAWPVGVAVKIPFSIIAAALIAPRRRCLQSTMLGTSSALAELGIAASVIILRYDRAMSTVDISLYASSAGLTELLVIGIASVLWRPNAEAVANWKENANRSLCVRHQFFLERSVALAGHVGSRGLVTFAVLADKVAPAFVAIVAFALTDALAAYGDAAKWQWTHPSVCRWFYGTVAAIAAVELTLFAWLVFI